jgi:dTDP-4-amino-4,6-dideoxygalactose transaminase
MAVPFFRHELGTAELDAIGDVFKGPVLTTGAVVARFEEEFAALLGRQRTVAVTSCTGALHLCLIALGIGPGDEVITTPQTFVATATAIIEAGATPVFVDVEPDTGNLDADLVEAAITARTKAIMPVHLYGLMCDMHALRRIADRHGLRLIEDAAHCIEGRRDGIGPGEVGDAACFSFYATKNLTCGEGGAIVTDDAALADRLVLLRLHGIDKTGYDRYREGYRPWDMVAMGWKYNMSNIEAAILLPQLPQLARKLERRDQLAERYRRGFEPIAGIALPASRPGARHARHLFPIWVDQRRDSVIEALGRRGIGSYVNYTAVHLNSWFVQQHGSSRGEFPIAESIGDRTLSLPFFPSLRDGEVDEVISALADILATELAA